ncbi:tetratricopeptide repeat protein [Rhodospirillaceae bacterium SYSU D60014]|uniref:tetratricopeptide repeat protein n=1 Tax=Virgifigura deserti TaxID=2268457 RepID=UPI0013C48010
MICRFVAALIMVGMSGPAWAGFEEGMVAFERYDYAAALEEWRPLAEQGDPAAQFRLGDMYRQGRGVRRDAAEAVRWYHGAAEQGHPEAQFWLAKMYETGRGVERQDIAQAVRWFAAAAARGKVEAMRSLGERYASGEGVKPDLVTAHKWLAIAARRGNNVDGFLAESKLRELAARMTPEQIQKAEALVRDWTPKRGPVDPKGMVEQPAQSPEPAG